MIKKLYSILLLLTVCIGYSQNPVTADLDLSFNYEDEVHLFNIAGMIKKTHVLPNGKILVLKTSNVESYDSQVTLPSGQLIRLNPDYTLDATFRMIEVNTGALIHDFDLTSDGGILVVGDFTSFNGITKNRIVKLSSDGENDDSFSIVNDPNFNNFVVNTIQSIKVLSSGNIVISGMGLYFSRPFGAFETRGLARILPTGVVDESFQANFPYGQLLNSINVQSDGKILFLKSQYTQSPNTSELNVFRLNTNGTTDTGFYLQNSTFNIYTYYTFNAGGNVTTSSMLPKMWVQSDDKIIVFGDFTNNLKRLTASGVPDSTYQLPLTYRKGFSINPDNTSFLMHCDNSGCSKMLSKLDSNGSVIWTKTSPEFNFSSIFSLPNNEILAFTTWNELNNITLVSKIRPVKLTSSGDELTGNELSASFAGKEILKTVSNEYLILGPIRNRGPLKYHKGIKRVNNNGALLPHNNLYNSFTGDLNIDGVTTDLNQFYGGLVQPDGKILIFEQKYSPPRTYTYSLIRLNADFTIDTGFTSTYNSKITDIELQSDGKIVLMTENYPTGNLIRLNSDGSVDATFNSIVFNSRPLTIEVLTDDRILVGGNFSSVNFGGADHPVQGYTCLNADGSFDTLFAYPANHVFSGISKVLVQSDGKILLWGNMRTDDYSFYYRMIRLNSDFTKDNTFLLDSSIATMITGNLYIDLVDFKTQVDDKILFVFFNRNDITYSKLIRVNENGALDAGFDTGMGFNRKINAIHIQNDGHIVVTGEFTKYNGTWCNGTVRLVGGNAYKIKGTNRIDTNLNGCTAIDPKYANLKFNMGSNQFICNTTGSYSIPIGAAGIYTVTPVLEDPTYFTASPSSLTVDFPAQVSPYIQDFCITPSSIHPDLEVVLIPVGPARPGFDANYKLVYKNKGNQVQSGTVTLTFNDAVLDIVTVSPSASTSATNTRTWNFTNLIPLETREVTVKLNLNSPTETPALHGGDFLNYTASITSPQTDEKPNDNNFVFRHMAVNSYDPNDKTCLEGTIIAPDKVGDYVHYVIRFENTGTYPAQNITVRDFIDTDKFDINTLVPLSGSHLFVTKISEGNKVEFVFENINLPYTAGTNTGYVAFKIKTKSTLVSGDTFSNGAGIYFDYNSAITTNTYTTTIQALSTQDFSFANYFTLYPNPVSDVLNISRKEDIEIASIQIYNVMGQLMMVIPNAKNTSTIDVSNLASGNYFVKINSDKGTSNTKFIKK